MSKELTLADLVKLEELKSKEITILKARIKQLRRETTDAIKLKIKNYKSQLKSEAKEKNRQELNRLREQIKLKEYDAQQFNKQIRVNLQEMVLGGTAEKISEDNFGYEYKLSTNND